MSTTVSIAQATLAALAAGVVVFAYLLGKTVGADEERKRIVRSKANIDKTRRAT